MDTFLISGDPIEVIERLFAQHGHMHYEDRRTEPVSALAHALQCAQLAEWAGAEPAQVAAALLHDIGHFFDLDDLGDQVDDAHEERAHPFLRQHFGEDVAEPVRLHVAAKRFLVATSPEYAGQLSPASVHSLLLQGGPMSGPEVMSFQRLPYAVHATALRRWDDAAKHLGKVTPSLTYYLTMLADLRAEPEATARTRIGPAGVA